MLRTFTCIMCPQGCEITAELPEKEELLLQKEDSLPQKRHMPTSPEPAYQI